MAVRARSTIGRKGITLIEFILAIVILAVLGIGVTAFFIPLANMFFATPRQTAVQHLGQEIMDLIIDGDSQAKGLRYAKGITAATATQIDYTDSDDKTVAVRWDATDLKFYRNINAAGEQTIPLRYLGEVRVQGKDTSNIVFQFFKSDGTEIASPVTSGNLAQIKRVKILLNLYTGSGVIKDFQGRVYLTSGVEIKRFI